MNSTANRLGLRSLRQRWHRYQSKCYVLRSQIGFERTEPSRPRACMGCCHYHGQSYGHIQAQRTQLICGMHPLGWREDMPCPDWQSKS
jgi:hypothetical protein